MATRGADIQPQIPQFQVHHLICILASIFNTLAIIMASSEVDQKFLGAFAKSIGSDNPLLSAMLFKILGLSVILSKQLIRARKQRKLDPTRATPSLDLYFHILWLAREGLSIVEAFILPMVNHYGELKVLSYKLRASFCHIFVLFHNQPSTAFRTVTTPPGLQSPSRHAKGKSVDRSGAITPLSNPSSIQPDLPLDSGGPVGGRSADMKSPLSPVDYRKPPSFISSDFLLPKKDYIPIAHNAFKEVNALSESLLWGSHPLRLSVKLEYAVFLYDCLGAADESRELARRTIREVYDAQEGMDDDMFEDAAELVGVLGRMMKRGLPKSEEGSVRGKTKGGSGRGSRSGSAGVPSEASKSTPRVGMGGSGTLSGTRTPGMDNMI